ncbi:MAG: 4-hydroxy-3-methylbut-2-enyl diphosphate reductase [Desulfoarculaceae bacterium]|nr:4-hydroxy-3-methylbut-2-enyl diphosphate reductase [Desulfoarculaceae bacterium]
MSVLKEIILANPRGFCAGVVRAIATVRLALEQYGPPIYVLHEIVHNKHVVQELEELGVVFMEELADIPRGAVCIFSAHGVSAAVELQAQGLGLLTIDATCPLVNSVHRMVEKYHAEGCDVLIIGHHRHPEVEGAAGRVVGRVHVIASEDEAVTVRVVDTERVAYVTQTTLSQNDITGIIQKLEQRFPAIRGPRSNVCYATQNRQNVVKELAQKADILLVVGSKSSSNSNRLREVGGRAGMTGYLIDDETDIRPEWLQGHERVGVTAGASAPERLVRGVVDWLQEYGATVITELPGKEEQVSFQPAVLEHELRITNKTNTDS